MYEFERKKRRDRIIAGISLIGFLGMIVLLLQTGLEISEDASRFQRGEPSKVKIKKKAEVKKGTVKKVVKAFGAPVAPNTGIKIKLRMAKRFKDNDSILLANKLRARKARAMKAIKKGIAIRRKKKAAKEKKRFTILVEKVLTWAKKVLPAKLDKIYLEDSPEDMESLIVNYLQRQADRKGEKFDDQDIESLLADDIGVNERDWRLLHYLSTTKDVNLKIDLEMSNDFFNDKELRKDLF